MSYFPSITQSKITDTANSVSTTLASGSTWNSAGTGTSTISFSGVQVVVASDQNMTVYIDQGRTSSTFQITDTYVYNVIKGNFGFTVQVVAPYVRVRVKNVGATLATFTVDTSLVPIVEAVPRSLDTHGHMEVSVEEISDTAGNFLRISPAGWMDVNQPYRLVGTAFGSAIDTNFWTATNNGTGSASGVANSIATLASGTRANAWAQLVTARQARFVFNNANKYRSIVRIPTVVVANTNRYWGPFTATAGGAGTLPTTVNGFYFQLDGSGVLSVNSRNSGGTVNTISSGSFNGDISSYTVDTNAHVYEITHFLEKAQFYIDGVWVHTMPLGSTLLSSTYTLPVGNMATTSGTNSGTMEIWAGTIHRLGRDQTAPRSVYQAGAVTAAILKSGPGRFHGIVNGDNVGTAIFYDALTATNIIASFDLTRTIGSVPINIDFYTGLTYTTTGAPKLTVVFE